MREIKFRAWVSGKMHSCGTGRFTLDWVDMPWGRDLQVGVDGTTENKPTLMQFTGLKDKNGIDIYEGDLIEPSYKGRPDEVVWDSKRVGWRVKAWYADGSGTFITDFIDDPSQLQVIGNIYENEVGK